MMKSYEVSAIGLDKLALQERPIPQPGAGEVLLRLKAASLNYRDLLWAIHGMGGVFPYTPLSDACAEIVETGSSVTRLAVGDRVAPMFFQGWYKGRRESGTYRMLGGPGPGVLQEYVCLSQEGVSKVPAHLSDHEVASLPCAALTAWRALAVDGALKAGDRVLIQGTGGVSLFALQFAKAAGAEVILTSSSEEKLARARQLGADHLINYKANPQWSAKVREITVGRGVDHVVEVGGAATIGESIRSLAVGGTISLIGLLGGSVNEAPLSLLTPVQGRMQAIGAGNRDDFEQMCRAITATRLHPIIDRCFAFEDAPAAFAYLQSQQHFGKIVIDIARE